MRLLLFFTLIFSQTAFAQKKSIQVDKNQAKEAYYLLNEIRTNPKKYARELGLSDLNKVTKTNLIWNDELARVAEFRAYDMANRNYFDHVTPEGIGPNYYIQKAGYHLNKNWVKVISSNNFESIAANHPTAIDGMKALVRGQRSNGYMHRKHVLGMDDWNKTLVDIGVGFVNIPNGSIYKTYMCVIIAKHDW